MTASQPQPYVSQHDLRSNGTRVRWLPQAPPGPPDLDGRTVSHKLMCLTHWSDEVESHLFSFVNMMVTSRGSTVLASELQYAGNFEAPAISDIHILELANTAGEVLVTAGTMTGGLLAIRLHAPKTPGRTPDDVQFVEQPTGQKLTPQWQGLHAAAISSVDVQQDSQAVLTVAKDGSICVLDMEAQQGMQGSVEPFFVSQGGLMSFNNGRWVDTSTFATVSALGGLQVWDIRSGPKPISSSPPSWGPTGSAHITTSVHSRHHADVNSPSGPAACMWLHTHPSRPDLATTGSPCGEVAVWDLRFASQPLVARVPETGFGDVWEVRFDPLQNTTTPGVIFCTEGGCLGSASATTATLQGTAGFQNSGSGLSCSSFYSGSYAINSFDIDSQFGADIVAVTDGQELLYVRRQ